MPKPARRFVSPADAAEYLTISLRSLYSAINRGAVRTYKLPGAQRVFIDLDELDAVLVPSRTSDDAA